MNSITEIAKKINLSVSDLKLYGKFIAKIKLNVLNNLNNEKNGKLILISAINPTLSGEGKTTISIGLVDAFYKIGKVAALSLREPSLGPVFGMKGGATGSGFSKIEPSDDINLHFTGDMHAITAANNLLCALVDNHLNHGNSLQLDPKTIVIKRCVDINDRALRNIVIGLGAGGGVTREEGFTITAASEIMAILCLASSLQNLKDRIGNILIGFSFKGEPIFVRNLNVQGAVALLLKDAFLPNLVQTLKGSPVFVHGGPFANIAHGCCSIMSTSLAMKLADYAITEAGFGADLGAEKFFNIKCRVGGFKPSAVVLVVTAKALKFHGGVAGSNLSLENIDAIQSGCCNLAKHIENMRSFGVEVVVAINKFSNDFERELVEIKKFCEQFGCFCIECDVVSCSNSQGAVDLAQKLVEICNNSNNFKMTYEETLGLEQKVFKICTEIYGASEVCFSKNAQQQIKKFEQLGFSNLPVCICKTPYSLSADKSLIGRPANFKIEVKKVLLSAGAGFVIMLTGEVLTMPGLGKEPAANFVNLDCDGTIKGIL